MELDGHESNPNADTLQELAAMQNGEAAPEAQEAQEAQAQAPEQEQEQAQAEKVIYDGQEFDNEKQAYEYMREKAEAAERDKLILEARQEGIESALQYAPQGQSVTPQAEAEPEDDSDEFYSDPVAYQKKLISKTREELKAEIRAEAQAEANEQREWNEFFNAHPDLADFREDCQDTLNRNLETVRALATKDKKKAQDFLAQKTREKFQRYIEASKPRTALSNARTAPSMGINDAGVTPQKASQEENALDMVSQMAKLRR